MKTFRTGVKRFKTTILTEKQLVSEIFHTIIEGVGHFPVGLKSCIYALFSNIVCCISSVREYSLITEDLIEFRSELVHEFWGDAVEGAHSLVQVLRQQRYT
jgi:hypothetical protein